MRKEQGFTIIELMIGLFVMAILVSLALPSFSRMILNSRSQAQGEELAAAINYTRSEAVKRGRRVAICASNNDGTACGTDWTNGVLVFEDDATSDVAAAAVVGTVLKHWEAFHDKSEISATRGGVVTFVRFTSQGMLGRIANSTERILFAAQIDGCTLENAREVAIGVAGMVGVSRTDCT